MKIIDDLPQARNRVKFRISEDQAKQKDRHDKNVKHYRTFQIGDQVLYFNVTLDHSHSGKFNPKWKGPFVIHQVLPHGAYKLAVNEGQLLPTPINGNLLKLYRTPLLSYK
jgi:hypothetical protein